MNSTKTFSLLKTLSKKEMQDLSSVVKNNKRKSLHKLLELSNKTVKQKRNISLKNFFELYYKKPYNKKDDNLLRNELRLLNNIVEQFIVEIQISKVVKQNEYFRKRYYLEFLFEQESYDLLAKELNKVFKQIEVNEDYIYFYDFFSLWIKLSSKNFKMETKFFSEARLTFIKLFVFWKQEVAIKTRKLEYFKAFLNRVLFMLSREHNFEDGVDALDFKDAENNIYYNFLGNKANSLKSDGEEKIELLLEMRKQLNNLKTKDIDIDSEKFVLLQYLGVEYMIKSDYENALPYFDESLELSKNVDDDKLIKGIYNHISTLIKLKEFSKAILMFNQHYEKIKKSNIIDLFHCIITMSYVFTTEIEKAEELNKVIDSNKSVGNFLYSRCNLAILFYENGEKELALNELTNIVQSVNYHKNQDEAYRDFTSFFKSFILLSPSKSIIKENTDKLVKMKKTIKANFKKSSVTYGSDMLHLLWLHDKLEELISS